MPDVQAPQTRDPQRERLHIDRAADRHPHHRHPRRDRDPRVSQPEKSKATDSSAKELARTAQTTTETYGSDNSGSYKGLWVEKLHGYETTIQTAAGSNNAYLSGAKELETGAGYEVTATSATSGHTFTIKKLASGEVKRECTPTGKAGAEGGGSQNSSW